jgi:SAM-dependent methyltransferase
MADGSAYLNEEFARLYDWACRSVEADVSLYNEVVAAEGAPVLEVGCCTGRVSIALARTGSDVTGFDPSPPMVAVARDKLRREPQEVQDRVAFHEADMSEFDFGRTFPVVIVPLESVLRLLGKYSLNRCFRTVYKHTAPGGVAVVDCLSPHRMADRQVGSEEMVREVPDPSTGKVVQQFDRILTIDWAAQLAGVQHVFFEDDGHDERKHVFQQDYRWLRKEEGAELLEWVGFPHVEVYGDYDRSPHTGDSPRLMFLARRLERDVR